MKRPRECTDPLRGGSDEERSEILNQVRLFYQALYTKEEVDPQATSQLLDNVPNTLTDIDNTQLEVLIREMEVTKAIKDSNNNKSPGPDGLTYSIRRLRTNCR